MLAALTLAVAAMLVVPRPACAQPASPRDQLDEYLQAGRYRDARGFIDTARAQMDGTSVIELLAQYTLERRRWDEAMALLDEPDQADARATRWYAVGLAAARAAWPGGKVAEIELARRAVTALDAVTAERSRLSLHELRRVMILAAVAAAQEEREEMTVLLTHGLELADGFTPARVTAALAIPADELAGDLWLQVQVHRYADAQQAYERSLGRQPGRARSVYGLARAAAGSGDWPVVRRAATAFLDLWASADQDQEELEVVREYLQRANRLYPLRDAGPPW